MTKLWTQPDSVFAFGNLVIVGLVSPGSGFAEISLAFAKNRSLKNPDAAF